MKSKESAEIPELHSCHSHVGPVDSYVKQYSSVTPVAITSFGPIELLGSTTSPSPVELEARVIVPPERFNAVEA